MTDICKVAAPRIHLPSTPNTVSVDNFTVRNKVAEGAHGVVFLGEWRQTPVVLKVAHNTNVQCHMAFSNEFAVYQRLQPHPFLVHVKKAGIDSDSGRSFMMLEYCARGDFYDLLYKVSRLDVNTVRRYGAQLTSVLHHMHMQHVVHGDVKVENMLLHADGNLRLCDMGAAVCIDAPRYSHIVGTPRCMAPEQWKGAPVVAANDCWSLGIVLYTLFVGVPPWYGESEDYADIQREQQNPLLFPASMPDDLRTLVGGLLRLDPAVRFTIDEVMRHAFFELVNWSGVVEKK
jgi:serine/threonine protein kinase